MGTWAQTVEPGPKAAVAQAKRPEASMLGPLFGILGLDLSIWFTGSRYAEVATNLLCQVVGNLSMARHC